MHQAELVWHIKTENVLDFRKYRETRSKIPVLTCMFFFVSESSTSE